MSGGYPPGVSGNEDYLTGDYECPVCGCFEANCVCEECPTCGEVGRPGCYSDHGMELVQAQIDAKEENDYETEKMAEDLARAEYERDEYLLNQYWSRS